MRMPRARSTSPEVGSLMPAMRSSSEVLPAPLAPTTARRSRDSIRSSTAESTTLVPYASDTSEQCTSDIELSAERDGGNPAGERSLRRLHQLVQRDRSLVPVGHHPRAVNEIDPRIGLQAEGVESRIDVRVRAGRTGRVVRLDVLEEKLAAELGAQLREDLVCRAARLARTVSGIAEVQHQGTVLVQALGHCLAMPGVGR